MLNHDKAKGTDGKNENVWDNSEAKEDLFYEKELQTELK
jgi:hypothetical protein